MKNDHPEEATAVLLAMDPEVTATGLRVGLGLDSWRTVAVKDPHGRPSTFVPNLEAPYWDASFNSFSDTTDGVQMTLVMGLEDRNWNLRFVAVDANGTEHRTSKQAGTPREGTITWTCAFRNPTLQQVREFRIEVQPVYWVEFPGISLNPVEAFPAANRASFGPVQELGVLRLGLPGQCRH